MANDVLFGMHEQILNGVNKLANAVQATLGPSGKNVIIHKGKGYPLITKDGVTVARNIILQDQIQNIGALMVKEVASKSNELAGDGTTTATVLARAIFKEGLKYIVSGYNPIDLKRDIDLEVGKILALLKEKAKPILSEEDLYKVALVSTNNDFELAGYISKAIWKVGKLGTVAVEDSKSDKTELRFVDGMQIERGLISKYFVNELSRMRAAYDNPKILICNYDLDSLQDLRPVLELAIQKQFPLIIFANEYEDNLLAAIIANKVKAGLKVVCLHTPGTADYKPDYIEDLALATGATVFEKDHGLELSQIQEYNLGTCDRIVSTFYETSIIGHRPLEDLIETLKASIDHSDDVYMKAKLKDRYSRLTSGIAILGLNATSDTELKDMKLRVEDAINAVRAAVDEGVLPGGGLPLFRSSLEFGFNPSPLTPAQSILEASLKTPITAILENAGLKVDKILNDIEFNRDFEFGYDARSNRHGNMFELGIIDPAKVVRSSLQNASSVAGMLLTTACCVIAEEKVEK